jgi:hypothetical protein
MLATLFLMEYRRAPTVLKLLELLELASVTYYSWQLEAVELLRFRERKKKEPK